MRIASTAARLTGGGIEEQQPFRLNVEGEFCHQRTFLVTQHSRIERESQRSSYYIGSRVRNNPCGYLFRHMACPQYVVRPLEHVHNGAQPPAGDVSKYLLA